MAMPIAAITAPAPSPPALPTDREVAAAAFCLDGLVAPGEAVACPDVDAVAVVDTDAAGPPPPPAPPPPAPPPEVPPVPPDETQLVGLERPGTTKVLLFSFTSTLKTTTVSSTVRTAEHAGTLNARNRLVVSRLFRLQAA